MFLRYVANVLPSLGETAVTQATMTSLLSSRVRVRGADPVEITEVKGRLEMADVIRRVALSRVRPPKDPVRIPVGLRAVTIEPAVELAQKTALEATLPLNDAKTVYAEVLLREVRRQLVDRSVAADELHRAIPEVRRGDEFRKLLDRTWPRPAHSVRDPVGCTAMWWSTRPRTSPPWRCGPRLGGRRTDR